MLKRRCTKLTSSPIADQHFGNRYITHEVIRAIDFDDLKDTILEYYKKRKITEDGRHVGHEGSRYRVHIPVEKNMKINVVVEETPDCLLPVTTWLKSFR